MSSTLILPHPSKSVLRITDYYGTDADGFGAIAGPGQWNDPDMLIIGSFGLSLNQVSRCRVTPVAAG